MSFLDKPSKALTLVDVKSGTDLSGISTSDQSRPTNNRAVRMRDPKIPCQNEQGVAVRLIRR